MEPKSSITHNLSLHDFEVFDNSQEETDDTYQEPEHWTIISALERVLELAQGSKLCSNFWKACKNPVDYLTQELGLTPVQVVALAILAEAGEPQSWKDMSRVLRCNRLTLMTYTEEIEELVEMRWVQRTRAREFGGNTEAFELVPGVLLALRHNKRFVPEKIDGMDIQHFMDRMESRLSRNIHRNNASFPEDEQWLRTLCKANPHLPLCHEVLRYEGNIHIQSLLLLVAFDYAQWADSPDEGLHLTTIDELYPEDYMVNCMRMRLREGTHVLIRQGLIEHKCEDGIANVERYVLTRKAKDDLLMGYTPSRSNVTQKPQTLKELKSHSLIQEKNMFYNATEQEQIAQLTNLLQEDNLQAIQGRLQEKGLRKGFTCLFYGAPGTGKTETVQQLARQTGRDIMQIDIASMRDKFVGESEKNIKSVFTRYRELCKNVDKMPILFFNEADGIFGQRSSTSGPNPSVEKMENAMQNIILQEMETLDGILIATTNLTQNLDSAFDRRFLFKVEFRKPGTEVKAKLWTSMLGDGITPEEAEYLAKRYDFSGGQIENIARKQAIDYILTGKPASLADIDKFCQAELLDKKGANRTPIGFKK